MRFLFIFGIFLIVIGIIVAVVGFKERAVASQASATPEEISLKDLIARGPDGNPNIILTDYVLCDNFVYETKTQNGPWQNVWVPAVPREHPNQQSGGKPAAVQALIFSINARNQNDMERLCNQPKLKALVTNRIVSLGSKEKDLLRQSYPGTNFDKCLIIQEGREPAGMTKLVLMMGGGALAALLGVGMVFGGFGLWLYRRTRNRNLPGTRRRAAEDDEVSEEDEDRPRPTRRPPPLRDTEEEPRRRPRSDEE
jgi:hypothetical protein